MFIHSHIFHPLWNCIPLYISCILMPLLQLLAGITRVIGVLCYSPGKTKCRANTPHRSDMNHITTKSLTSGFYHIHMKNCFWCFSFSVIFILKKKKNKERKKRETKERKKKKNKKKETVKKERRKREKRKKKKKKRWGHDHYTEIFL